MRYCRFLLNDQIHYGGLEDRNGEIWIDHLRASMEEDLAFRLEYGRATSWSFDFEPMPLSAAHLRPAVTPSKIVCIGRNYREHVKELGHQMPSEPLLFLKPPSSLQRPGGAVRMPSLSSRVDFEGELAVVIGKHARNLKAEDWRSAVRGYTLANDVTARDLQASDGQWSRAKGFDTFCPVGPLVSDEIDVEAGLTLETRVNGELRQQGSTRDFIFPIPVLLEYITRAMTLLPGDIVLTGTPSGVGPLKAGDVVEVSVDGLGVLSNVFQPEENYASGESSSGD
jgi:2-keto-4-pentenoate hydratase/2-oxohepta-3-ene-1,7-dioic acid hydratase in catechol pathway